MIIGQTAFYIIYGVGAAWFLGAAIYTYQAAIKDFIQLAREGKEDKENNKDK